MAVFVLHGLLDALLAEALAPVDDFSDDSIQSNKQVLHA
jgi:hypothetical protein